MQSEDVQPYEPPGFLAGGGISLEEVPKLTIDPVQFPNAQTE